MIKTENNNFHNSEKPLLIIPAAGFGRRAGSPLSKELILGADQEPLINRSLQQAAELKWPVHMITREEKIDLIEHVEQFCQQNEIECHIQAIPASKEWPETVLQSEPFWRQKNILILPDTSFEPVNILKDMVQKLNSADLVVAGFKPKDSFSTWGFFRKISEEQLQLCEKPNDRFDCNQETKAWGLLGFRKEFGKALFAAQLESTFDHSWKAIKAKMLFSELTNFQDETRQSPTSLI